MTPKVIVLINGRMLVYINLSVVKRERNGESNLFLIPPVLIN